MLRSFICALTDVRAFAHTGNLGQFFDIDPYAFHEYLHSTFGKAMKIHGMFGVRLAFCRGDRWR